MSPMLLPFAPLLLVGVGTYLSRWYRSLETQIRLALLKHRRRAISAVEDGAPVKVGGQLGLAQAPLVAPLSGRLCAAWRVVVEGKIRGLSGRLEEVSQGKRKGLFEERWEELIKDEKSQEFFIDDGTGTALVKARAPALALRRVKRFRASTTHQANDRLGNYLASRGQSDMNDLEKKYRLRYLESVLKDGEWVEVFGTARLEPDPDTTDLGYREAAMRVVLCDPDQEPMLLSGGW